LTVTLKLFISQLFKSVSAAPILCCLTLPAWSQAQKPSLPDPVKFINKYDIVWNVARWALTENMGLSIELEDRKGGRIVTKPYEFITGSLTTSEVDKLAVRNDVLTGSWLKARYSAETILEVVSPTETLVTVRANIEALNRDMDGSEKWLTLESLGTVEKRILGKISMKLLGNEMQFDSKKGFWDRNPQSPDPRAPKTVRPPI
jgi:hypothetical protein